MPRRLRIEYPDAIYHMMARGNGRQDIVSDDLDRKRLRTGLERSVTRTGWRLYAFVVLSNQLHSVLKTPRPNLAPGNANLLGSITTSSYPPEMVPGAGATPRRATAGSARPA